MESLALTLHSVYSSLLTKVKPLSELDEYQRSQLADACVSCDWSAGDKILQQGKADGARLHILISGSVRIVVGAKTVKTLSQVGAYFGELSLGALNASPSATVVADSPRTTTIALSRSALRRLLGADFQAQLSAQPERTYVFQEPPPAGDAGPGSGAAAALRPPLAQLSIQPGPSPNRLTISPPGKAEEDGGVPRSPSRPIAAELAALCVDKPLTPLAPGLTSRDLTYIKELGSGMTATVYLAWAPTASATAAAPGGVPGRALVVVKVMRKSKLIGLKQVRNVMVERQVLSSWSSNHIVRSYAALVDPKRLYLLLEYLPGGDLFRALSDVRSMDAASTRFYSAEVLLALSYIHAKGYVYRDLKPENVLLDREGHIRLADMGFCKKVPDGERTRTTCGTADYLAPEVLLSATQGGYNRSCDLWALGVLVYELLSGAAPFHSDRDVDERGRMERICKGRIEFGPSFNLQARNLVCGLTTVEVAFRLGMGAQGMDEIFDHPFFGGCVGFDWAALASKRVKPPCRPDCRPEQYWAHRSAELNTYPHAAEEVSEEDDAQFAGYAS